MDFRHEMKKHLQSILREQKAPSDNTAHLHINTSLRYNGELPFVIQDAPGKGRGVVATEYLWKGRIIINELPLMLLPRTSPAAPFSEMLLFIQMFVQMTPKDRSDYLALSSFSNPKHREHSRRALKYKEGDTLDGQPDGVLNIEEIELALKLDEIFQTNAFNTTLYRQSSRFNHSCDPNMSATVDNARHVVFALRDIQPGEEMTMSYVKVFLPIEERLRRCEQNWGFRCQCPICDKNDHSFDTTVYEAMIKEYRGMGSIQDLFHGGIVKPEVAKAYIYPALDVSERRKEILKKLPDEHATYLIECLAYVSLLAVKLDRYDDERSLQSDLDVVVQTKKLAESSLHLYNRDMMKKEIRDLDATLADLRGRLGRGASQ